MSGIKIMAKYSLKLPEKYAQAISISVTDEETTVMYHLLIQCFTASTVLGRSQIHW